MLRSKYQSPRAGNRRLRFSTLCQIVKFIQATEFDLDPITPRCDFDRNVGVPDHGSAAGISIAQRDFDELRRAAAFLVHGPHRRICSPLSHWIGLALEGLWLRVRVSLDFERELRWLVATVFDGDVQWQRLVFAHRHRPNRRLDDFQFDSLLHDAAQ